MQERSHGIDRTEHFLGRTSLGRKEGLRAGPEARPEDGMTEVRPRLAR